MNNELKQASQKSQTIADLIENKIRALIGAGVTIWGINISELLEAQRKAIAKAQAEAAQLAKIIREKDQAYDKLHAAYRTLLPHAPSPEPVNTCEGCGEQCDQGEEGEDGSEINVEIKVTGNGPIPPELVAMLNDLASMLQSVAHKK